jgi:hypothetical protein
MDLDLRVFKTTLTPPLSRVRLCPGGVLSSPVAALVLFHTGDDQVFGTLLAGCATLFLLSVPSFRVGLPRWRGKSISTVIPHHCVTGGSL